MKAYGDRGGTAPLSFLTSALEEDKRPAPAALPPNKEPLLPIQRGTRSRGGRCGEEKYVFSLSRMESRNLGASSPWHSVYRLSYIEPEEDKTFQIYYFLTHSRRLLTGFKHEVEDLVHFRAKKQLYLFLTRRKQVTESVSPARACVT